MVQYCERMGFSDADLSATSPDRRFPMPDTGHNTFLFRDIRTAHSTKVQ